MKVILLGKGQMLANMIESSLNTGVEIVGVLRYERLTHNTIQLFFHDLFKSSIDLTLIKKHKLPEIKCNSANSKEFRDYILKTNTDLILVGTWREKIRKETFSMPKIGTVNIHPSLLPRYRGPNPYHHVILQNERKSGVTIHLMDENFDSGAILLQKEIEVFKTDTAKELRDRTLVASRELVGDFLRRIQSEVIIPITQNESRASYQGHIDENLKLLDFKNNTAEELSAIVRACHPWLPCYIEYQNIFYKINPYNFRILNNHNYPKTPGTVVAKDAKNSSITFICKDYRAIQASKIQAYGIIKRIFTKYLIKKFTL